MSRLITGYRSDLTSLKRKSEKIFSIFEQTKVECEAVNKEIEQLSQSKKAQLLELQAEINELDSVADKNKKLSDKIDAFLNS